jgi:hypothetical protein
MFSVTEPGDNASQCLNISPVANSGNAQTKSVASLVAATSSSTT